MWSILILLIIFVFKSVYKRVKNIIHVYKLPGPKRYPILGNLLDLLVDEGKIQNF